MVAQMASGKMLRGFRVEDTVFLLQFKKHQLQRPSRSTPAEERPQKGQVSDSARALGVSILDDTLPKEGSQYFKYSGKESRGSSTTERDFDTVYLY
jgi:hypothetical protein